MTNQATPCGFKPLRYFNGAPYAGQCRPYYVRSDYATALYLYDPVVITSDGGNAAIVTTSAGGSFGVGALQTVNKATAGTGLTTGVIVAFAPNAGAELKIYNPASTERVVYVADDPNIVFRIKDDGGAVLTYTSVSLSANFSTSTAGSTASGLSGVALAAATTPAANATYQLHILGQDQTPDNTPGEIYQNWDVMFNLHTYRGAGVITGV